MNQKQSPREGKKIKVLSLFDGISCARVALERAGFEIDTYVASETDKYAIQIAQKNYPDTIQVGDVRDFRIMRKDSIGFFDLIIGGSPCQDLSIAKKNRKGLKGERSGLFWEYVRILKETKPKYFILENVASMSKESKEIITKALGVEPIMINAALVSAQQRKRLFWTNIKGVEQPKDKEIYLKGILESKVDEKYFSSEQSIKNNQGKSVSLSANGGGRGAKTGLYLIKGCASRTYPRYKKNGQKRKKQIEVRKDEKSNSLTSVQSDSLVAVKDFVRKLTPIECERLQCLPDNWTEGVSNTQRYKALGNAFNVDVIAHILSFIK